MRPHDGGLCIVRTTPPIGLFEVIEDHLEFDPEWFLAKHYTYEKEKFTLKLHYYGGYRENKTPSPEEAYKMASKDMDKAWNWFKAYMEWEDKQLDLLDND